MVKVVEDYVNIFYNIYRYQNIFQKLIFNENFLAISIKLVTKFSSILKLNKFKFSDCLDRLHWLPVSQRCKFKLLWLIACSLKLEQPAYLFDILSIRHTRQPLRSLNSGLQRHQPVFSGLFISRSFSHHAPRLWNSLPSNLRSSPSIMNFRKLLKTHLYHKHPQS